VALLVESKLTIQDNKKVLSSLLPNPIIGKETRYLYQLRMSSTKFYT